MPMNDQQKAAYIAGLYALRQKLLDNMTSSGGKVTRQIDGQTTTYSGPAEMMKALREVNAEIASAESDGQDFGFALAIF